MEYTQIRERRNSILSLVQVNNVITVEEICDRLNLTDSTVRRDIKWLESQNLIRRFHGGVSSVSNQYDTFDVRKRKYMDEKKAIGKAAVSYIEDGDILFLGGGSTMLQFCRSLLVKNELRDVVIVTANLNIAMLFAGHPRFRTIILGGNVIKADETLESTMTIEQAATINYTKVFNGAMGVSIKSGITQPSPMITELERTVANNASELFTLVDHSKFSTMGPYTSYDISRAGTIITDKHPIVDKEISKHKEYKGKIIQV